ncbi:MAG: nitrate/nitrite transporter NrtS [Oxalobacteraceae bacterium]|nr:nitrate/nitrite transporter NrtS [Oxalobacteraceae bacterium]
MRSFLRIVCSARIAHSALRVALVVGTVLNLVNQSGAILVGIGISWFHLLLNYFVPYCVASYSAAKNEITRREDED